MTVIGIEGTAWNFSIVLMVGNSIEFKRENSYTPPPLQGLNSVKCFESHKSVVSSFIIDLINYLELSNLKVGAIRYSKGPGFYSCLQLCYFTAKYLSIYLKTRLEPVHHGAGHLSIIESKLGRYQNSLVLYVSGGHCSIYLKESSKFTVLCETGDITIGNCLDKFARLNKINHPGGPEIEKLAIINKPLYLQINKYKKFFFFSGLIEKVSKMPLSTGQKCSTLHEYLCNSVVECLDKWYVYYKNRKNLESVVVMGGVANNQILVNKLKILSDLRNFKFCYVKPPWNSDNGVMIALTNDYILDKQGFNPNLRLEA